MVTLIIDPSTVELIALPAGAIILGVTIYFFIKSRRSLQQALKAHPDFFAGTKKNKPTIRRRSDIVLLEEQFAKKRFAAPIEKREEVFLPKKETHLEENIVQQMKATIVHQQKLLDTYLQKAEDLENEGREKLTHQNNLLEKEIDKLHGVIEKKDEEIEDLYQQAATAKKMAAKIEEVYREFDMLQSKMLDLEKQANRSNNLSLELEDTRQSYEQAHKELVRKQEKLEEILNENQRMRQEMNTLEDKLSEANLQRQQLQKKVMFLQELNTDMQSISETNKKLQTELRRIGELESMLNMMAEEREFLLRNKQPGNRPGL